MSALNIFLKDESVAILTDTAAYKSDGVVLAFGQKCVAIPHLRMAIASRGSMMITAVVAANVGAQFDGLDALIDNGAEAMRGGFRELLPHLAQSRETEMNLVAAGWSEKAKRAAAFVIFSEGVAGLHGLKPWVWYPLDPVTAAPVPAAVDFVRAGFDVNMDADDVQPVKHGLQIMQAQRAGKYETIAGGSEKHHVIGGHAVLTEVSARGVSQRVIHQWPDRIGERIKPAPLSWQIHEHEPMSRQQRRAAERAARKGRAAA